MSEKERKLPKEYEPYPNASVDRNDPKYKKKKYLENT